MGARDHAGAPALGIAKAKAAGRYKRAPELRQLRAESGPAAIAKRLGVADACRWFDAAASVDRDECETVLGSDLDRCLDITGHYQRRPVGTVEYEGQLAIAHA